MIIELQHALARAILLLSCFFQKQIWSDLMLWIGLMLEEMRYVAESVPRDKLRANVSINLSHSPDKEEIILSLFLYKSERAFYLCLYPLYKYILSSNSNMVYLYWVSRHIWANISLVMEQSALHFVQSSPRIGFPDIPHIVAMLDLY